MSGIAKHIMIARTQGVEAGFEAYLAAPSTKIHPAYQRIMKRRKPETRLAAYCAEFGDKIEAITPPVVAERHQDAVQDVAEAMIDVSVFTPEQIIALRALGVNIPEPEAGVEVAFITRMEAWEAAGADPTFKPKTDGDAPANNGQLYRLNMMGKLAIV